MHGGCTEEEMGESKFEEELEGLSRDEFADALAKGLGRALLYVKTYGLDRVKDLVLYACLHDVSYDAQIEGSRAKWLFAMFAGSPDYLEFREAILAAMLVKEETWVLLQLCGLTKEMALIEDSLAESPLPGRIAEQALADFVYRRANFILPQPIGDYSIVEDWIGVNELIEVRGINALLELSRIYGRRLLANRDDWVMEDLQIFNDKPAEIVSVFEEYAKREESIAVYYHYLIDRQVFLTDEERESIRQSSPRQKISISQRLGSANETILNAARNKEREHPSLYTTFGVRATAAELDPIFELLLTEADEDICLRLLWIFRRTPLPRLADRLFDWADSPYDKLRMAAVEALAQISDDRVYQLGRSKLAHRQLTGINIGTIELFINNYHSGDAKLILAGLNDVEINEDDRWTICYNILSLSRKQSNPELGLLLNWMYDHTPCSCCRNSAVSILQEYGQMSDILLAEYPFDSTQWDPS
jgi:hypothetical protein